MSDIKMVNWPKRPAEVRRDELEIENAELKAANEALKVFISRQEAENAKLRNLVQQMREYLTPTCRGCAFANTSKCDNCRVAGLLEAAERGGE